MTSMYDEGYNARAHDRGEAYKANMERIEQSYRNRGTVDSGSEGFNFKNVAMVASVVVFLCAAIFVLYLLAA